MSERPTPETDGVRFYLKTRTTYDLTDFEIWESHSAKLERERDEAREKLSHFEIVAAGKENAGRKLR